MGMGDGFFGNCSGGTTGTIVARERELLPIPVKGSGNIPTAYFPRTALENSACPPSPGTCDASVQLHSMETPYISKV